jgi:sugar lactone lactonase YvrE
MRVGEVRVFDERVCELGEGPVWHASSGRAYWVDILSSQVLWRDPASGAVGSASMPSHVGAILPTRAGGWLACLVDGVYRTNRDLGEPVFVAGYPHKGPGSMRANDAKVSPDGTVLTGTMSYDPDAHPGAGALYALRGQTLTPLLESVTISNGIGWSPDAALMYFVDSPTQRIDVCDVTTQGNLVDRRPFAHVPASLGLPDGLSVDAQGNVWVAVWGGGCVLVFSADGVQIADVKLPTPQTTSCAFIGPDLTSVLVTTAAIGRVNDPHAGLTYVFDVDTPGQSQPEALV